MQRLVEAALISSVLALQMSDCTRTSPSCRCFARERGVQKNGDVAVVQTSPRAGQRDRGPDHVISILCCLSLVDQAPTLSCSHLHRYRRDAVGLAHTPHVPGLRLLVFCNAGQARPAIRRQPIADRRRIYPHSGLSKVWQNHQTRLYVSQDGRAEGQAAWICVCRVCQSGCKPAPVLLCCAVVAKWKRYRADMLW